MENILKREPKTVPSALKPRIIPIYQRAVLSPYQNTPTHVEELCHGGMRIPNQEV